MYTISDRRTANGCNSEWNHRHVLRSEARKFLQSAIRDALKISAGSAVITARQPEGSLPGLLKIQNGNNIYEALITKSGEERIIL